MSKEKIDLSIIKDNDLDKTGTFTDLMSRKEKKERLKEIEIEKENLKDDLESMIDEKKRSTKDLSKDLEKANMEYNKEKEDIEKTQILELTRQMKFNFEEKKNENSKSKNKWVSKLNIIGEINLLCILYYIYLLVFTNYQDNPKNYSIGGLLVVSLVLIFGLSVVTSKKISTFFNILNILIIFLFIAFNIYSLI